jgi:hypothetical protein
VQQKGVVARQRKKDTEVSFFKKPEWLLLKQRATLVKCLLELHFLVLDMLASLGIELHDQHLFRHCLLVLGRGVEVASTRSGFQLDLVASAFGCHVISP